AEWMAVHDPRRAARARTLDNLSTAVAKRVRAIGPPSQHGARREGRRPVRPGGTVADEDDAPAEASGGRRGGAGSGVAISGRERRTPPRALDRARCRPAPAIAFIGCESSHHVVARAVFRRRLDPA